MNIEVSPFFPLSCTDLERKTPSFRSAFHICFRRFSLRAVLVDLLSLLIFIYRYLPKVQRPDHKDTNSLENPSYGAYFSRCPFSNSNAFKCRGTSVRYWYWEWQHTLTSFSHEIQFPANELSVSWFYLLITAMVGCLAQFEVQWGSCVRIWIDL